jgi:hypothetical protein
MGISRFVRGRSGDAAVYDVVPRLVVLENSVTDP